MNSQSLHAFHSLEIWKSELDPLKSDILLKTAYVIKIGFFLGHIYICMNVRLYIYIYLAHNSFKLVNDDIVSGIGPSIDVPCKSLQKNFIACSRKRNMKKFHRVSPTKINK